jgi:hypothetical protein
MEDKQETLAAEPRQESEAPAQPQKKPYSPPQFFIYGGISDLTQNLTNMGTTQDNPAMKT